MMLVFKNNKKGGGRDFLSIRCETIDEVKEIKFEPGNFQNDHVKFT